MIKLSQEKNKKPIKVFHSTDKKYKYPIIDIENGKIQSQGFGSNAYGPGFYTTNDKEVINGYKLDDDYYVRTHIIPRGAVILDYNNAPVALVKKFIVGDISTQTVDLGDFTINNTTLNRYLLSKGVDVIKYLPGKNQILNNPSIYKGYNYLIINENIINNPRGKKDYSETEQAYKNKSVIPEIIPEKHWEESSYYTLKSLILNNPDFNFKDAPDKFKEKYGLYFFKNGHAEFNDLTPKDQNYIIKNIKDFASSYRRLPEDIKNQTGWELYCEKIIPFGFLTDKIKTKFGKELYLNGKITFEALPMELKNSLPLDDIKQEILKSHGYLYRYMDNKNKSLLGEFMLLNIGEITDMSLSSIPYDTVSKYLIPYYIDGKIPYIALDIIRDKINDFIEKNNKLKEKIISDFEENKIHYTQLPRIILEQTLFESIIHGKIKYTELSFFYKRLVTHEQLKHLVLNGFVNFMDVPTRFYDIFTLDDYFKLYDKYPYLEDYFPENIIKEIDKRFNYD